MENELDIFSDWIQDLAARINNSRKTDFPISEMWLVSLHTRKGYVWLTRKPAGVRRALFSMFSNQDVLYCKANCEIYESRRCFDKQKDQNTK
jgi:hypothetical protein